ncbi:uncharacterized protein EI90DRAFT_3065090 [Cantharellus anzutake]|uniref:uncharacterized protein n=1 Tax=Cantharellus anzutake TaxID=1750568 RepID=UPI001903EEF7|nr:uncharacterized protein EI90DRAFT_3065090 [Cantharellus anzutake]KAF8328396.1 hypothetical protein EI90DRAFT_3065090 [Cantharellus anzutake]
MQVHTLYLSMIIFRHIKRSGRASLNSASAILPYYLNSCYKSPVVPQQPCASDENC